MMKKGISILLALALMLGCGAALAESTEAKTELGTLNVNGAFAIECAVPEDYSLSIQDQDSAYIRATLKSTDEAKPTVGISIAYNEEIADIDRLNDVSEEGLRLIEASFQQMDDVKRREAKLEKDNAKMSLAGKTQEQEELIRKYGFYTENNCYWFYSLKGNSFFKGSNFTMEPLFHIVSTINAKRLYRLKNVYGKSEVLEFSQKDLISIAAFRLRCESLGNFLFEGGDHGLNKIKAYLYDNTKTCREVTQLGWQKQGFFAWSNGITVEGEFRPIGELGDFATQYADALRQHKHSICDTSARQDDSSATFRALHAPQRAQAFFEASVQP